MSQKLKINIFLLQTHWVHIDIIANMMLINHFNWLLDTWNTIVNPRSWSLTEILVIFNNCLNLGIRMHIGCILGAYWMHIGCILDAYWVHIGCILDAYWVHNFWMHIRLLRRLTFKILLQTHINDYNSYDSNCIYLKHSIDTTSSLMNYCSNEL